MRHLLPKLLLAVLLTVVVASPAQASPLCSTDMMNGATPICVASNQYGLTVYYIGEPNDIYTSGVTQPMPYDDVDALAGMHPKGSGNVILHSGVNPVSGAAVTITYLADDELLHFNTYTWDNYYNAWKPYIFVVDEDNEVTIWVWDWPEGQGPDSPA